MKKNFAMRIAACLLVVTMLSLCMVSYTYAKYTTADSKADIAQVAKWGVTVQAEFSDLFEEGYDTANSAQTFQTDLGTATTLTSVAQVNMLAPGTTDEQVNALVIKGTPEVAVSIDYSIDIQLLNWATNLDDAANTEYCPLVITVETSVLGVAATKEFKFETSVADLEKAIEAYIEGFDAERVDPNTDLNSTFKFSWSWAYEVDQATNIKDTALGNNAANGKPATFYISLGATVTQIY